MERLGKEMKEGGDESKGCVIVIQEREGKDKESEAGRWVRSEGKTQRTKRCKGVFSLRKNQSINKKRIATVHA